MILEVSEQLQAPALDRAIRSIDRQLLRLLRIGPNAPKGQPEELNLRTSAGLPFNASCYRPPVGSPVLGGVVICPDQGQTRTDLTRTDAVADPREISARGFVVFTFDPIGRGEAWGEEDHGGREHQDQVHLLLDCLSTTHGIMSKRCVLLGLGAGACLAVQVAARHEVGLVIDWEGPTDRETWQNTLGNAAIDAGADDDFFWACRSSVPMLEQLRCAYIRLQAEEDHAHPGELRHAHRAIFLAARSHSLTWFQINHHPRGELPPRPRWLARGRLAARRAILAKIGALGPLPS